MGRITSGVGLVSGINSKDIIDQLMALEARPKDLLQSRIDGINQQKLAFTDLSTKLVGVRLNGQTLSKPSTFQGANATSSDEDVVTATTTAGAAVGSYQIQVARLVTTQQVVSRGYEDFNSSKLGAGTITIGLGGGELSRQDNLADLNGGAGVRRGQFRITDRSGASTIIDITAAVTLQDVVKKINTSLGVQVHASLTGDTLKIDDLTGKTASNLIIQDVGDGHSAQDLGITQSVTTTSLTGTDINYVGRGTALSTLNDGRGVGKASTGDDFSITPGDGGAAINISLASLSTVGQVIDAINTASAGRVTAALSAGGNNITLTDASGGPITVAALNNSTAARDLGILGTDADGTFAGGTLLSGLGTVLLTTLKGGAGLTLGTISIKDRAAGAGVNVNLSGAKTVQDVLDTLNNTAGVHIRASLTSAGNAIQIEDTSAGAGTLDIAESGGGTSAADLGILGSFALTTPIVKGANLHRQYVSGSTLLSDYNGGKGVQQGKIKLTNSNGISTTVNISTNQVNIGDVIQQINSSASGIGITASVNANGNGILLTDSLAGAQKLKVEDVDSTTARDLLIKGTATTNTIDGAQEKTIAVTANDTLATLQTKINDLNYGVTAAIINDGTAGAPFRLSVTAKNGGRDGRVVFDGGATSLDTHNLVEAQDAAVFLGGAGAEQPLLITSSSNQITGAIKGATINLNGVSDGPVSLNITRTPDAAVEQLNTFVENFNALTSKIAELTKFDTDTNTPGLLLGDSTVQSIETEIYASLRTVVPGNGKYRILADVGVKVIDGGQIEFDEEKFRAAFADDPDAIQALFSSTNQQLSLSTSLSQLNSPVGIRTAGVGQNDIHVITKSGAKFDVSLASAASLQDVATAFSTASAGKVTATLGTGGNLILTDKTGGFFGKFSVSSINGSNALRDLGLDEDVSGNSLTGRRLIPLSEDSSPNIAGALVDRVNKLIDPVDGILTRENHTLEDRTLQFESRIKQLDSVLENKRTRLERQFSSMESVLGQLQSQQTALNSFKPVTSSSSK